MWPRCGYQVRVVDRGVDISLICDVRAISDETPSNELKILQLLNTKEARLNPRNHAIPVIEFLTFDKFTFVVMPR